MGAVGLQAVLTVCPEASVHQAVLGEAIRVLRPRGLLYISDFLRNEHLAEYRTRYAASGRPGVLSAYDDNGRWLYDAKHWTIDELLNLLLPQCVVLRAEERYVRTRTGNEVRGFEAAFTKLS